MCSCGAAWTWRASSDRRQPVLRQENVRGDAGLVSKKSLGDAMSAGFTERLAKRVARLVPQPHIERADRMTDHTINSYVAPLDNTPAHPRMSTTLKGHLPDVVVRHLVESRDQAPDAVLISGALCHFGRIIGLAVDSCVI